LSYAIYWERNHHERIANCFGLLDLALDGIHGGLQSKKVDERLTTCNHRDVVAIKKFAENSKEHIE